MNPVQPYAGQSQQTKIQITAASAYQQTWEESCWVMPPYSALFPPDSQGPGTVFVPPPVQKTDLWSAQQTWPL